MGDGPGHSPWAGPTLVLPTMRERHAVCARWRHSGRWFLNSTAEVDELPLGVAWWNLGNVAPNLPAPARQANQAGFYGTGDIWSVGG